MADGFHRSNDDHNDACRNSEDLHIGFGKETPRCICTPSDDFHSDNVSIRTPRKADKEEDDTAVDIDDHMEAACHMSDDMKEFQKYKECRTLVFRNYRKQNFFCHRNKYEEAGLDREDRNPRGKEESRSDVHSSRVCCRSFHRSSVAMHLYNKKCHVTQIHKNMFDGVCECTEDKGRSGISGDSGVCRRKAA